MNSDMDLNTAVKELTKKNIEIVRFELSDFYGISHSKSIPARHFHEKVKNGLPFFFGHLGYDPQAGLVSGTGYNEETNYGDCIYHADLNTLCKVPWAPDTARVLMTPHYKGEIVKGYPRSVAKKMLDELSGMGYSFYSAHEHEFLVMDPETKKPVTEGVQIRATIRLVTQENLFMQIAKELPLMGVDVESIETEYAPGQFEITYKPTFGLASADNAFTFKNGIKEIAQKRGLQATFMTKPFRDRCGSSAHFNHSLWDTSCQKSLMYDASSVNGLSKIAQHWLAGLLYHAPAIAVLMSPTVNCLTRYEAHAFAPENVTWGVDNRSCAIRVKIGGEKGTYIENRMGSAAGCPYTSLAATVAAGIDGIKNQYELPPEMKGLAGDKANIPPKTATLPYDMESALKQLLNDKVICDSFGSEFIKCFVALKDNEVKLEKAAKDNGKSHSEWAMTFYADYI